MFTELKHMENGRIKSLEVSYEGGVISEIGITCFNSSNGKSRVGYHENYTRNGNNRYKIKVYKISSSGIEMVRKKEIFPSQAPEWVDELFNTNPYLCSFDFSQVRETLPRPS